VKKKKGEDMSEPVDTIEEGSLEDGEENTAEEPELSPLEALRQEKEEVYDQLLRKHAEFENYRKRVTKERQEFRQSHQAEVLRELLTALDACEKGIESFPDPPENPELEVYRQGYELILKELRALLFKFNVTEISAIGSPFDPNLHEAVLREETTKHREGQVVDEFRKGYLLHDRLLRAAQVKVAVQPVETETQEG